MSIGKNENLNRDVKLGENLHGRSKSRGSIIGSQQFRCVLFPKQEECKGISLDM